MPERKTMRRIRECYRLYFEVHLSQTQIAELLKIGRSTVWDYLHKLEALQLTWDDIKCLPEKELERRLYAKPVVSDRPLPDCPAIHQELRLNSMVTLQLLWEEYKKTNPEGYGYSQYCLYYRRWLKGLSVYMRQTHVGGEELYVDYSGKKPHIRDRLSGEDRPVELLVTAWGASQYLYAEVQESQTNRCWIMGHVRSFEYSACVPRTTIPDNLKSAVTKASLYDPDLNRTYTDLATHYGFGVVPARPGRPKDKAKVENGVRIVQRWILAALRHRVFYSIDAMNVAIRELLEVANNKPMKVLKKSRRELFLELDKPNALPLPKERFEYHEWLSQTVNIDYHIEANKHYYSVPWTWHGKTVSILLKERTVEIFYKTERIAMHERNDKPYGYTTQADHMPISHQKHIEWTPQRLILWAKKSGVHIGMLVEKIIVGKPHPQHGFRPALGIMRLGKTFGNERLDRAAELALRYNLSRVGQINDILKRGLDRKTDAERDTPTVHNTLNIRGREYFLAAPENTDTTSAERTIAV